MWLASHYPLGLGAVSNYAARVGGRIEEYRAELRRLEDWEPYLTQHSGLPGARANLELIAAVVEDGDRARWSKLARSNDEFIAACGAAGLGRIALAEGDSAVMSRLRELAADPRWRVREGVAIGLQRFGRDDMGRLIAGIKRWSGEDPFTQRAAVAALCEPPLLKDERFAAGVLAIMDRITASLAASSDRRSDGFRALRQALGYGWSVAAAAYPEKTAPYFKKWMRSNDPDITWVMKSNLGKSRMKNVMPLLER